MKLRPLSLKNKSFHVIGIQVKIKIITRRLFACLRLINYCELRVLHNIFSDSAQKEKKRSISFSTFFDFRFQSSSKKDFVLINENILEYLLPRETKMKILWWKTRLSRWHFWFPPFFMLFNYGARSVVGKSDSNIFHF